MNTSVPLKESVDGILRKRADTVAAVDRATVLIATMDSEIRDGLAELFQAFSVNTIWLQCVAAAKKMLAKEKIAACFCGFWLQDGTYRELVRHIRRERVEIPVIIVSPPACPHEYGEYLAAVNIGALDYLCHPYRKSELERMLSLAMGTKTLSIDRQPAGVNPGFRVGEAA